MAGGASTVNGTVIAQLKANVSGQVQTVPPVTLNGGRERVIIETVALAAQAAGAKIAVARLPIGAALLGFTVGSDQAPGAVTIQFGDYNDDARYVAAVAPAGANALKACDVKAAAFGVPIVTGYDSDTGRTDK